MDRFVCWTIGHSTHEHAQFMRLLNRHGISCVVDVRSSPYSRRNPRFNREAIRACLRERGIAYLFLGEVLGARQASPEFLYPDGITVDFKKIGASAPFQAGIDRLMTGLRGGSRISLMCAEKDPYACHRFMLVSRALRQRGVAVLHILADGGTVSQDCLEEKLLAEYAPHRRQPGLFCSVKSRDEDLEDCYDRRNREIGYRAPG